jgi:DNA-binding NarL/FixJ family response regulator
MSAKEAADTLVVSKRTVDFHLANIFEKLSCNNRVKAYRLAVDMELMEVTR